MGSSERIKIGNNVFIGMKSRILKGVHIGNNVVIGANSLVNKDVSDDCVVAGNLA
ncbi:transferase, partial [Enterococcus faecium]